MAGLEHDRILVSVLIITYNQEKYIEQTIVSVVEQEGDFDLELIIGEDCSSDQTRAICKAMKEKYPDKIKLLLHEQNLGLMKNYYAVMRAAKGKYIAQLAGDDFWTDKHKLAKQVAILEQLPQVGLVFTDVSFLYEDGRIDEAVFKNNLIKRSTNFNDHLEFGGFIAPSSWMYRSRLSPLAVVGEDLTCVDESFPYALDMFQQSEIYYLDQVTCMYRRRSDSLSNQNSIEKKFKYFKGLFKIQTDYLEKYSSSPALVQRVKTKTYINYLNMAFECQDDAFIEEGMAYLSSEDIRIDALVRKIRWYEIWYKKKQALESHVLLKPFVKLFKRG